MTGLLLLLAGVWVPSAQAESDLKASINGDIKTFYVATIPYDNALFEQSGLMPSDPISQGILDGRLKVKASHGNVRVGSPCGDLDHRRPHLCDGPDRARRPVTPAG